MREEGEHRVGNEGDFYHRTQIYAFLEVCFQGKLFSCPIRVQTILQHKCLYI